MTLTAQLYNSHKWQDGGYKTVSTPMVQLVRKIEKLAKKMKLVVSRIQTEVSEFAASVTWAVHEGTRAVSLQDLPKFALWVSFDSIEGQSERSEAYTALARLLSRMEVLNNER